MKKQVCFDLSSTGVTNDHMSSRDVTICLKIDMGIPFYLGEVQGNFIIS